MGPENQKVRMVPACACVCVWGGGREWKVKEECLVLMCGDEGTSDFEGLILSYIIYLCAVCQALSHLRGQ